MYHAPDHLAQPSEGARSPVSALHSQLLGYAVSVAHARAGPVSILSTGERAIHILFRVAAAEVLFRGGTSARPNGCRAKRCDRCSSGPIRSPSCA